MGVARLFAESRQASWRDHSAGPAKFIGATLNIVTPWNLAWLVGAILAQAKLVDVCAWRDSLTSHATPLGATLNAVTPWNLAWLVGAILA